jgi:prolyl oligopeptidase
MLIPLLSAAAIVMTLAASSGPALTYPAARTVDHTDDYHGTKVADPYRWLESLDSPEVKAWVGAQNSLSQPFLAAIPARKRIVERLTTLWNYERYEVPFEEGGHYFYRKNDGLQNQSVLYVMDRWGAEPRVLIDPNGFSKDGTIALDRVVPSPDGRLIAYSVQDGGSDWRTWKVRDVASGNDTLDALGDTKFTVVSCRATARASTTAATPGCLALRRLTTRRRSRSGTTASARGRPTTGWSTTWVIRRAVRMRP